MLAFRTKIEQYTIYADKNILYLSFAKKQTIITTG